MYHSKTRQNKLIKICGNQTQEQIVAEINNSSCPMLHYVDSLFDDPVVVMPFY